MSSELAKQFASGLGLVVDEAPALFGVPGERVVDPRYVTWGWRWRWDAEGFSVRLGEYRDSWMWAAFVDGTGHASNAEFIGPEAAARAAERVLLGFYPDAAERIRYRLFPCVSAGAFCSRGGVS